MSDVDTDADRGRLLVTGLCKTYSSPAGSLTVLKDVSFTLQAGETLAVVGASGTGKSTLLNIIGSLDVATSGSVELNGKNVGALRGSDLSAFRARHVGFVFQDHHLLPQCTALENVLLPTLSVDASDAADAARDLLRHVGLAERMDYLPATLSGGERQRVAIARAMVNGAPLLLCDEPTGNLDRDTGQRVADLFIKLARERGTMLIVVTHDRELAKQFDTCRELRDSYLREIA